MKVVSLEKAQRLADLGYRGPTDLFWDRYNPNPGEEGPQIDWRLSPKRSSFDNTCCLPAPTRFKAFWLLLAYKLRIKR